MQGRLLALLFLMLAGGASAQTAAPVNVAGFANGAQIASVSNFYASWEADYLLDESAGKGWSTQQGAKGPFSIVIALAENSEIRNLEFDNTADRPERASKDVEVQISSASATAGFTPLQSFSLKPGANRQKFPLAKPATGRWLKLVIKANHGDPEYSELMDFRAYGRFLAQSPLPQNLSGTYATAKWGNFHLLQKGAALSGCYEHSGGLIHGGLESHLMRLTWTQDNKASGPAVMVMKPDGKGFVGWWRNSADKDWTVDWDLRKVSNTVGRCAHWRGDGSVIASEINSQGRSRLYGINFDSDSARLRSDALPEVAELLSVLKLNTSLRVSIDGHTDNTGQPSHNLDLSKRRAAAVVAELVRGGIDPGRMTSQGLGQTMPVADNATELGRAQNRRGEVVKK